MSGRAAGQAALGAALLLAGHFVLYAAARVLAPAGPLQLHNIALVFIGGLQILYAGPLMLWSFRRRRALFAGVLGGALATVAVNFAGLLN